MDVCRGMSYLHAQQPLLIHHRISSSSILLSIRGQAKITSFALSPVSTKGTRCAWTAPEILACKPYDQSCDVYSFAILLWEAVAWTEPYGDAGRSVTREVCDGLRPEIPSTCSTDLLLLLSDSWQYEPSQRPSFPVLLARLHLCASGS
jgi:serine/threonine protein kinase